MTVAKILTHGAVSYIQGFIVPENVNIHIYSIPGAILRTTKNHRELLDYDIKSVYEFKEFDYMFDIGISLGSDIPNYHLYPDTNDLYPDTNDVYRFIDKRDEDYLEIDGKPHTKENYGNYFSNLVYKLIKEFNGYLTIHIICCLDVDVDKLPCKTIVKQFFPFGREYNLLYSILNEPHKRNLLDRLGYHGNTGDIYIDNVLVDTKGNVIFYRFIKRYDSGDDSLIESFKLIKYNNNPIDIYLITTKRLEYGYNPILEVDPDKIPLIPSNYNVILYGQKTYYSHRFRVFVDGKENPKLTNLFNSEIPFRKTTIRNDKDAILHSMVPTIIRYLRMGMSTIVPGYMLIFSNGRIANESSIIDKNDKRVEININAPTYGFHRMDRVKELTNLVLKDLGITDTKDLYKDVIIIPYEYICNIYEDTKLVAKGKVKKYLY